MKQVVIDEVKQKNPLRPQITQKSSDIANKAGDSEFRRSRKLSQKAHSKLLTKPSQTKENKRE